MGIVDDTVVTTIVDLPAPMMIAILVLPVVVVMIPDGGMIGVQDGVMGVDMRESTAKGTHGMNNMHHD